MSPMRRRRSRRRGQSMAEFVIVLPIMIMIAFTTLDLYEFISVRGRVFDLAAASLEAVTAAKPPDETYIAGGGGSGTPNRLLQYNFLCKQLYAQTVGLAKAANMPNVGGMDPAAGSCTGITTDAAPVAVDLITLASLGDNVPISGGPTSDVPYGRRPSEYQVDGSVRPAIVRVCVHYRWVPLFGVFYFAKGLGQIGTDVVSSALTWHFCGRTALDPRRTY